MRHRIAPILLGCSLMVSACSGSTPGAATRPPETSAPKPTSTVAVATATALPPSPTPSPAPTDTMPSPSDTPLPPSPTLSAAAYNADLNYAQVRFVRATQDGNGLWRFDVTVEHNDEGWDHYADAWQVVDPAGNVLAERVLAHPHDNEQPFTRSQSNIEIPSDLITVTVRAKCNVHGFGGQEVKVDLTVAEGERFEVN